MTLVGRRGLQPPSQVVACVESVACSLIHMLQVLRAKDTMKLIVIQPCPTLCKCMNYSLPGSSVPGIFQARILEWVAISFSRGSF